jgi:hypothetical protein
MSLRAEPPDGRASRDVPPEGFLPLSDLTLDGRMVRFSCDAGAYEAPAVASSFTFDTTAVITGKNWMRLPDDTFGYGPDAKFIPTGWAELTP